jgi:hypothetical protein
VGFLAFIWIIICLWLLGVMLEFIGRTIQNS